MPKLKSVLIPAAVVVGLWGLGEFVAMPQLEKWSLVQLEKYSQEYLPVTIKAQEIDFGLLSLSAKVTEISSSENVALKIPAVSIDQVRVHLDLLKILSGQIMISGIIVDGLSAAIDLDPFMQAESKKGPLPLRELFTYLEKIPVKRAILQNTGLTLKSSKPEITAEIGQGNLTVTNLNNAINASLEIPELLVDAKKVGVFSGGIDFEATLNEQDLTIENSRLSLGNSEITGKGTISEFATVSSKLKAQFNIHSDIDLADVYHEFKKVSPQTHFPRTTGKVLANTKIKFDGLEKSEVDGLLQTQSVEIGPFVIGDASIQGKYKDKRITFSEIQAQHPSGQARLKNSEIKFDDLFSFETTLSLSDLDLYKLFETINLADIPVGLILSGTAPCKGAIFPEFYVACDDASLVGKNLWIKSSIEDQEDLFNIQDLGARGKVSIDTKKVYYKAQINMGDSIGTSEGLIDFSSGFNIKFASPLFDFKNIQNLAHLKFVGQTSISGFTSGDSSKAIFDMNLGAKNLTFDQFYLGNINTLLQYRAGNLHLKNIQGAVNKSSYLGDLIVMLKDSSLTGDFSFPTVDLADIRRILSEFYLIPFEISGTGKASAKVYGPLNFWKLNYDVKADFSGVKILGEDFDTLKLETSALDGNIHFTDVRLKRGAGSLLLSGDISSDQELNMIFDGRNWRLEESPRINSLSSDIFGNLNFAAKISQTVADPLVKINGKVSDTLIDNQEIADSTFNLNITKKSLAANFNIFNSQVTGDLLWPLEKPQPLKLDISAKQWDYSNVLALLGGAELSEEYQSELTGQIKLESPSGLLRKSTGQINVSRFYLQRNDLKFENEKPIRITMTDGQTTIRDFTLTGPKTLFQITGTDFTDEKLAVDVKGHTDAHLLHIFTPFLEDLGGNIKLSAQVRGALMAPRISGAASGQNNFIKIKGFPHPLERLNTDITFSENKILINSVKGRIADGQLIGEGQVQLLGPKETPINIRCRVENTTFKVPTGVNATGSGDLLITGSRPPFRLSGNYNIDSALVEMEFTETAGASEVRRSRYLPRFIREANVSPLILDLNIDLNDNTQVRNSMMNGKVQGRLQVRGPSENPILFGRIQTDKKSKVIFRDKVFDVQSGVVDFKDPSEINPNLYVSATSHINEYDVTLIAQGTAKNLQITLTSIPPLPEQDIISLIALGITSSAMEQNTQSRQQVEQVGAEIGGAVLAKPINKQLESTLGLNLSVTSDYDSTRNISVPKITLSRKLTDKMRVSGSRPVGNSESYDLKLEYNLNSNITAIGSFETKGNNEDSNNSQGTRRESQSIFGLDLEFKREFR